MSLLRLAGRTMLASFFVVTGAKAVANPEPLVESAEPLAKAFVPLAQKVAPPTVANYIPDDTTTLVRVTGAAQVVGGLMLATGVGRRLGATVLGVSMVPHVLASRPRAGATAAEREVLRSQLLRNVALLGGAILASLDTQGKPDLAWLARERRLRLGRTAGRTAKQLGKDARRTVDDVAKSATRTGDEVAKGLSRTARALRREARQTQRQLARDAKHARTVARLQVRDAQHALGTALADTRG